MPKPKSVIPGNNRRSRCPVACTLDIVGDRWTLLVVRDLMLGRSRFKEFIASPETIPTNILSDRLEKLITYGIAEQQASADGSRHLAYTLTKKGKALRTVMRAVRDWGLAWEPGTEAHLTGQ